MLTNWTYSFTKIHKVRVNKKHLYPAAILYFWWHHQNHFRRYFKQWEIEYVSKEPNTKGRRTQCQSYETTCSFYFKRLHQDSVSFAALTFTKGLSGFTVNCTDRISFPGWVDGPDSEWWSRERSRDLTYLNGSYWHQQVFQIDPSGWWRKPFNWHQVYSLAHPLPPLPALLLVCLPGTKWALPIWPSPTIPRPWATTCSERQAHAETTNLVCPSGVCWWFNTDEMPQCYLTLLTNKRIDLCEGRCHI